MAQPRSPATAFDIDMDHPPTVSPSALLTNSEYNTSDEADMEEFCFATLEFPDATYRVNYLSTLIGRNMIAQKYIEENAGFWLDGKRLRKPGSKPGAESPDREIEPPDIPDMESFEGDTLIGLRLSDVGGVLGPQPERIGQTPDGQDEDVVFVHPPTSVEEGEVPKLTSISKQHLRVAFKKEHGWTLEILGRNGAFHNDTYVSRGSEVELDDGDEITISGLSIVFDNSSRPGVEQIPIREDYMMDSDADSAISVPRRKATNGDDYDEEDEEEASTDSESEEENEVEDDEKSEEEEEQPVARPRASDKRKIKLSLKQKASVKPAKPARQTQEKQKARKSKKVDVQSPKDEPESPDQPAKRRGPGRPPADGIMSKRERREREKAAKLGMNYGDILPTRPKTKPKSRSEGRDDPGSGEESKQKKRKRVAAEGDDADETLNEDKKDSEERAHREPTPKETDYTEEQLQRPEGTYQPLLHQILSEAKEPLALPQIYEAFKKKWPYFRFRAKTTGWESSVRHNLTPNGIFKTNGKAGKGYLWTINPDVPYEPKVKRTSVGEPSLNHRPSTHSGAGIAPYQARPLPMYGHPHSYTSGYSTSHPQAYSRMPYPPPPHQAPASYASRQTPGSGPPNHQPHQYRGPQPAMTTTQPAPESSSTARPPSQSATRHPPPTQAATLAQPSQRTPTQPVRSPQPSGQPRPPPSQYSNNSSERQSGLAIEKLKRGETPSIFFRFKDQFLGMFSTPEQKEAMALHVEHSIAWVKQNLMSTEGIDKLDAGQKNIVQVLQGMLKDDQFLHGRNREAPAAPTPPSANGQRAPNAGATMAVAAAAQQSASGPTNGMVQVQRPASASSQSNAAGQTQSAATGQGASAESSAANSRPASASNPTTEAASAVREPTSSNAET